MTLFRSDLDGQFVFTQDQQFVPEGWMLREKNSWLLATHPSLPVTDVCTNTGVHLGWVLGYPITLAGELCPKELIFFVDTDDNQKSRVIESSLDELGGRFAAIFLVNGLSRLYLDPFGSLAAVFSLKHSVVASTSTLIDREGYDWDEDLIKALRMPQSGLFYPSGLTPRKLIRRLLPNHFLDLSSWKPVRHWPKTLHPNRLNNLSEDVKKVVRMIRNNLFAVAKKHPLHLSLTAGSDSRLLLACAAELTRKVVFFTFSYQNETVDSYIARKLAVLFNLNHLLLPVELATENQLEEWLYRTGYSVSGEIWKIHQTLQHLDPNRALLPAIGGPSEWTRTRWWRKGAKEAKEARPLDAEGVLTCFRLPVSGPFLKETEVWLSEVPDCDPFLLLDLIYFEQRFGCWAGPMQYGSDNQTVCHLAPFSHREIQETVLRLPIDYKLEEQFYHDIFEMTWPELLSLPFNDFVGILKYKRRIKGTVASSCKKAVSKLPRSVRAIGKSAISHLIRPTRG